MTDSIPVPSLKAVMRLVEQHAQHRVDAALAARAGLHSAANKSLRCATETGFAIQDALKTAGLK